MATNGGKTGKLLEIKGVVVDAVFTSGLPDIYSAVRIPRPEGHEQTSGANSGGPSLLASPSPRGIDRRVDHGEGGHGGILRDPWSLGRRADQPQLRNRATNS